MTDPTGTKHCPNCACALLRPDDDSGGTRTARVKELLRHNHPLLDEEVSALREIAEDARATLNDLDSKIAQAQELLGSLQLAQQQAQSRLEDTKSLLHPMRSIPSEILVEIFNYCTVKASSTEDTDGLDPKGAPWLLSRVCHRWRELAIDTPRLWTNLLLNFDKHLGHITDLQCAYKTGLFIQRSRGLLLDVCLGSMESVVDHPVLPVLEVSVPQWRYLDVDLPQVSLQCLSGNSFPNLRKLRLLYDEADLHIDVFQPIRVPVLRELEVITSQSWHDFEHVSLPWSRLTSVARFPAFDVGAVNYLRTMKELTELDVLATSKTRAPMHDAIVLPKLRSLTITESEDSAGCSKAFFGALAVPALSELNLDYHDTSVLHFPLSPLPPLENLIKLDITCEMSSHEENTQRLLDFLTLTHRVEWLRLDDQAMTLEFINGLNLDKRAEGSPVRLPCLRSLDIGDCDSAPSLNDDLEPFFAMLYSRLPTVMAEGSKVREETVVVGSNDNGPTRPSKDIETDTDPRARLAEDHSRCLETVQLPHQWYVEMRAAAWQETFIQLTSRVVLECGAT